MKPVEKLTECDARFWGQDGRRGLGISFDCPLCVDAGYPSEWRSRFIVAFSNPLDGNPRFADGRSTYWKREGLTLEAISIAPSFDATDEKHRGPNGERHIGWHGFVVDGLLVNYGES